MSTVFISHSSKDSAFAFTLATELLRNDLPVWLDTFELSIGDDLLKKIFPAMHQSNCMIVLLSKNYNKTIWTKKELDTILAKEETDQRKYLVPVKIDGSRTPEAIAERIYKDFVKNYSQSCTDLVRLLKNESLSVTSLPIDQRQIILLFSNGIDLDEELIKVILKDLHKQDASLIKKSQVFFSAYATIDDWLKKAKQNALLSEHSDYLLNRLDGHRKTIEQYIDYIKTGVLLILKNYSENSDIKYLSISISWFTRGLMVTIYHLISNYIEIDRKISDSYYPSDERLVNFCQSADSVKIILYKKNDPDNFRVVFVDKTCYEIKRLLESNDRIEFQKLNLFELLYKYCIPQLVFEKLRKEE